MQSMTKFMESSNDIIKSQQSRLSCRRFFIITDIIDHRFFIVQLRLRDKITHPCTTSFTGPCIKISIKQSKRFSVLLKKFINYHVLMINRQVSSLFKCNSKQLIRSIKYSLLQNIGQFKIRLDRKSTRLNSSHVAISYAVFCLKKKR